VFSYRTIVTVKYFKLYDINQVVKLFNTFPITWLSGSTTLTNQVLAVVVKFKSRPCEL